MSNPSPPARKVESENSLGSRVRRYAQVGGTVGVQAAQIAGARLMGRRLDASNAVDLKEALGGLKGPLMKVAQLIATIPGRTPAEYAAELAQLQSNAPPMSKPFVRRRMVAELGPDWGGAGSPGSRWSLRRRLRWAKSTRWFCMTAGPSPASCNIRTWKRPSTPTCRQLRLIFSLHNRYDFLDRHQHDLRGNLGPPAEELDYQQGSAAPRPLLRTCSAAKRHIHVPELVPELCYRADCSPWSGSLRGVFQRRQPYDFETVRQQGLVDDLDRPAVRRHPYGAVVLAPHPHDAL